MNKKLKEICVNNNLEITKNQAYGFIEGYETNLIMVSDYIIHLLFKVSTFLQDTEKEKIKNEFIQRNINNTIIEFDETGLIIKIICKIGSNYITTFETCKKEIIYLLNKYNAPNAKYCPYCGKELSDKGIKYNINGYEITLDEECKDEINNLIEKNNLEFKNSPNNIIPGTLGALLGALIGSITSLILMKIGYVAAISGVVAVLLGIYFYKKFSGKPNVYMYIIVSISSIVLLVLSCFIIYILQFANDPNGVSAIERFKEAMSDADYKKSFIATLLQFIYFTIIGVAIGIVDAISKNKRQKTIK